MKPLTSIGTQALATLFPGIACTNRGLSTVLGRLFNNPGMIGNTNGSTRSGDTLAIAKPLKALSESGVNLEKSRFVESAQLLSFNLTYEEESLQQVSLQGYYNYHSERLTADFSFISAMAVKDPATGEERQELFRFNLHLEASRSLTETGSATLQKEDILEFARKLVTKIAKLYAEGKEIDGLALDHEDLKDLAAVDHGHLLERIMATIELMKILSQMKKREGEHVWVDLEREKALVSQEASQEQESLSFSLTVDRIQTESVSESTPVEEAPEAA